MGEETRRQGADGRDSFVLGLRVGEGEYRWKGREERACCVGVRKRVERRAGGERKGR